MAAFSTISLVVGAPDGFVIQVGEIVAQAEFLPMNVTQYSSKKLFARQGCALGWSLCPSAIDLSIKLTVF
jgi:hypothetical protein